MREKISSVIKQVYPELKTLTICGKGMDNIAYQADGEWIFRFPLHDVSAMNLRMQVETSKLLKKYISTQIPYFEVEGVDPETGFPFAGYRKIKGKQLTLGMIKSLDAKQKDKLCADLAEFLAQLHAVAVEKARETGVSDWDIRQDLNESLEMLIKVAKPHMSDKAFSYAEKMITACLASKTFFDFQPALLHGDLSEEHVIVDDKCNLTGIIDFGDMRISDPYFDFYWLCHYFGKPLTKALEINYPEFSRKKMTEKKKFWWKFSNQVFDVFVGLIINDDSYFFSSIAKLERIANRHQIL